MNAVDLFETIRDWCNEKFTKKTEVPTKVSQLENDAGFKTTDTIYNVVSKTANGLVPKLPNEDITTKYLRQDGTWAEPPNNNTEYSNMVGATDSTTGSSGLVPAPLAGENAKFLRGDGTWQIPPDTNTDTWKANSKTSEGYVPAGENNINKIYKTDNEGNPGWMDDDHTHGAMKMIIFSTSEPETVAEGEIVMVYEDASTPPPITPTKNLTEITVTNPTKTEYIKNETFDISGIVVTAHYDTDETVDVTSNVTFNPENGTTLETVGNNTVTITYTEGDVTKTATISITVTESSLQIVTWSEGTDEQIAAMLDAHYNGDIDIHDYWHVGDERTVHLSAMTAGAVSETHVEQDVTMVLMNEGGKTLVEPVNGISECAFVVGQKNCLSVLGYMNPTETSTNGWDGCRRREWCNETYRNALSETFKILFKQHNNVTANGTGSTTKISVDYFALPSEVEVFGNVRYANATVEAENTQFDYYKVDTNRKKNCSWWERSCYSTSSSYFCYVNSGAANGESGNYKKGIAPFGCI